MADPYQPLERLRERIEYEPTDIFDAKNNPEKRFDRLLMGTDAVDDAPSPSWEGLEAEARKIIETRLGDEPLSKETGRVDEIRPSYDAAIPLVYPIIDVTKVEYRISLGSDWKELDAERWTHTEHSLILEYGRRGYPAGGGVRRNRLADTATRATWKDLASRLRVTYDRGFDPVPADILSVQVALVNRMLRQIKAEQTFAAASPEEFAGVSPEFDAIMTDKIQRRIDQFTPLGGATRVM